MYIYIYISADLLNLSHSWSLINEIKYAPSDVPLSLSILTWPCWFFALFRPDHPHPKLTDNSSQSQNSVKVFHFPMQWKAGCGVRVSSSSSWGQAGSYLAPTRGPEHVHHPAKCTSLKLYNSLSLNNHKIINEEDIKVALAEIKTLEDPNYRDIACKFKLIYIILLRRVKDFIYSRVNF